MVSRNIPTVMQYVMQLSRRCFHSKTGVNSAIKAHEFADALKKVWHRREQGGSEKLGLALSGGVDSMALAFLCHRFICQSGRRPLDEQYQSFIVDHKAREGSTEEAGLVDRRLERLLGVKPVVLTLEWPSNVVPLEAKNFESLARRLRYQALGRACREHGVKSLLFAHHSDDVAETILLRLADGHKRLGLTGIRAHGDIPECEGIYGVSQSGDASTESTGYESGGVTIHRPLLPFSKDRLIATCREASVEWVEDKTNYDPTVAPRNAVRSLLSSARLPVALQKPSLLALLNTTQEKARLRNAKTSQLYDLIKVESFDLRSGKLIVTVPAPTTLNILYKGWTPLQRQQVQVMALQRLIHSITPNHIISPQKLQVAADLIFPGISDSSQHLLPGKSTCGNVVLQRALGRLPASDIARTWYLYRQSFYSLRRPPLMLIPPVTKNGKSSQNSSMFQLWDGRFWIRIENYSNQALCVRPFFKGEVKVFLSHLATFPNQLVDFGDKDTLYTIPTIAINEEIGEVRGQVVAVPSLGLMLEDWMHILKYEIKYKWTDLSQRVGVRLVG